MKTWLFYASLALVSTNACACNGVEREAASNLMDDATTALSHDSAAKNIYTEILPLACKPWPQKLGLSIIAKAYSYSLRRNNGSDETYLGLIVAIINSNGSILNKLNNNNLMTVDAIQPIKIWIDTADYKLDSSNLAFGVRISRGNTSNVAQFEEEIINLYVQEGIKLRAVANGLLTETRHGEGSGRCQFSGSRTKTIFSVSDVHSNGYFDLQANTKTSSVTYIGSESSCHEVIKDIATKHYVLKYDGNVYSVPEPLKASLN